MSAGELFEDKKAKREEFTATEVIDLLRVRYAAPSFAFLEAVRNGTGFARNARTADALAMSLFPSRGLHLHGFEVKISRGDWMRELRDPEKAEEIAKHCNFWWIAAPAHAVPVEELPATWGLLIAGGGKLKIAKQATLMEATPPDLLMLAAILRRTASHLTDGAKIEAARKAGKAEGREEAREQQRRETSYLRENYEKLTAALEDFEQRSGLRVNNYSGEKLGDAVALILNDRTSWQSRFKRLASDARSIADDAEKALAGMAPAPLATESP